MYLPEIPYEHPKPNYRLVGWVLTATLLLAVVITTVNAQTHYFGASPTSTRVYIPDNLTLARAIRDLELKVKRLEAKVERLEKYDR